MVANGHRLVVESLPVRFSVDACLPVKVMHVGIDDDSAIANVHIISDGDACRAYDDGIANATVVTDVKSGPRMNHHI